MEDENTKEQNIQNNQLEINDIVFLFGYYAKQNDKTINICFEWAIQNKHTPMS